MTKILNQNELEERLMIKAFLDWVEKQKERNNPKGDNHEQTGKSGNEVR